MSICHFVVMASKIMYVGIFQTMCFEYNFIVSYISVKLLSLRLLQESLCYFQWIHTFQTHLTKGLHYLCMTPTSNSSLVSVGFKVAHLFLFYHLIILLFFALSVFTLPLLSSFRGQLNLSDSCESYNMLIKLPFHRAFHRYMG